MSVVLQELRRIFRSGSVEFPDPDPNMSPEDVLKHYINIQPILRNSQIEGPEIEGDSLVYRFVQIAKTKGACAL